MTGAALSRSDGPDPPTIPVPSDSPKVSMMRASQRGEAFASSSIKATMPPAAALMPMLRARERPGRASVMYR